MKKVMFLLAVGVMCLTACAQKKKDGERGPRQGGHMVINKDSDSVFAALKQETLGKFKQLTYNDKQTGKTMEYNLLVPEGVEGGEKLPLVLFMADASTAGKEVTAPLTQGYGALEFASNRDQQKPSDRLQGIQCRYQPTIHHRTVNGWHDVVLLQHHTSRSLCGLIVC